MHTQALAAAAQAQHGLWTRAQAREELTDRQIEARLKGEWVEVLPRVFRAAATPVSRDLQRRAAQLWVPTAMLSDATAGEIWRLEDIREQKVELTVASGQPRHPDVIVHRRRSLRPTDLRHVDGQRVTAPEFTIICLASTLDEETLEIAFESARIKRLLTVESVGQRLAPIVRPLGGEALRRLLADLRDTPAAESPLEVRVARRLRRSGLPAPVRQLSVGNYRIDFAWPEFRVALECDGRSWHSSGTAFVRDRERWSSMAAAGWRIVFVTRRDVATVVGRVRGALRAAA